MRKNLLLREISHVAQPNTANYETNQLLNTNDQGYVIFPSGEKLAIVTAKTDTGKGEKHYDPLNSGMPLLHVSEGDSEKFLSKSFQVKEFLQFGQAKKYKSKYGVEPDKLKLRLDPKLVEVLQKLRDHLNKSIKIKSGYRHLWYNMICAGAKDKSQHLIGRAADIVVEGMTPLQVAKATIDAAGADIFGIGIYNTFTHIDVRCGKFAAWENHEIEIRKYRKSKNLPNDSKRCDKLSKANPPEIKNDKPLPFSKISKASLPEINDGRPLPYSEFYRFEKAINHLEIMVHTLTMFSNDRPRLKCWINKLKNPNVDDRVIRWNKIYPTKFPPMILGSRDSTFDMNTLDQEDLQKMIKSLDDIESANNHLYFIEHMRPFIVRSYERDKSLMLQGFQMRVYNISEAVNKLHLWANIPIGGSSAMPPAYRFIKDWLMLRQRDPNSIYSCR